MILKRVGPLSCAKVSGTLYAVLGLIIGACVSLLSLVGGMFSDAFRGAGIGALFGVGSIVLFPIFYGIIGFLAALIGAWIYNVVAGWVGGVEVDLQ
jgi:hypothetical protein